jgi:hypothetical protein
MSHTTRWWVGAKRTYPLDLRVSESRMILASITVPYCEKNCVRSASVACQDTPPTNTLSPTLPPPLLLLLPPPSPSRASASAPDGATHVRWCKRCISTCMHACSPHT